MATSVQAIAAKAFRRAVGDILGQIQYAGETFIITRHGQPIAQIGPLPPAKVAKKRATSAHRPAQRRQRKQGSSRVRSPR